MVTPSPILTNAASASLAQVLPRPAVYVLAVLGAYLALRPMLGKRRRR